MKLRAAWFVLQASALCAAMAAPVQAVDCTLVQSTVQSTLKWEAFGPGLHAARVAVATEQLRELTLVRLSNERYVIRLYDMRDVFDMSRSNGYYAPPFYSIRELQQNMPRSILVASGGKTRSRSEPIPAGLLRIDGSTKAPFAPGDADRNGVLCAARGKPFAILPVPDKDDAPAPGELKACHNGLQAGRILVAQGQPTVAEHRSKNVRVVLGFDRSDNIVLAFSPSATNAAMGCALTGEKLGIDSAIALQGESLGGVGLGTQLADLAPQGLGTLDATIASALIIEQRKTKRPASQARK